MTHDDAIELLAPLALDALDADVQLVVEDHVLTCPRCQLELDGLREVASAMGNTIEPVPEDLWSKIASRLYEREGAEAMIVPPLVIEGRDIVSASNDRRHVVTRRARALMGTISLAAAAAIIALGVNLASANHHVNTLQIALAKASQGVVASALATPGHRLVTLTGTQHQVLATFVLLPDGSGYLVHSTMPTLPSRDTYQLWGVVNGSPVSIGIMGDKPHDVTFTLASSPAPTVLGVTVEPATGSLTPSTMIASGAV